MYKEILKNKMSEVSYNKLKALQNEKLFEFIGKFAEHCEPDTIYVCDDSQEDADYVRLNSLTKGEETKLATENQTIHFDGYDDQARDKVNTKFLVRKEHFESMKALNSINYEDGIKEVMGFAKGIMKGKDSVIKFFVEGPAFSEFTRPCVQFSDSWYVAHSEQILYRAGYEHFKAMENKKDFYRFIHSAGELDELGCTKNIDKRRIYMDMEDRIVYSMNDQYAGNSLGLKKHSMRIAIYESGKEGWLCEHMFLMNVVNKESNRKTYFSGAFPSACGKTSTAMIPGEEVVGDDIAYFRNIDGEFRAVNVEQGIFGIIRDVNKDDDPVIFENLNKPHELIFSNILAGPDNKPYWLGMGEETPKEGDNFSGPNWFEGKKDKTGKEIGIAHANARYTMRLSYLKNFDEKGYNDPKGVLVGGVLYGGRDSDITVPVEESDNWEEGIVLKAATIESETTAATLGKQGVRKFSPMANLDFVSYPLGQYITNNINFGKKVKNAPRIFATNYFLRNSDGKFCNTKLDKKVWLHWAEKRVHNELDALPTPTGLIPKFEDLKTLFKDLLNSEYTLDEYRYQFSFRTDAWIGKLERSIEWFNEMDANMPKDVIKCWEDMIVKIKDVKAKYGSILEPGVYKA